MSEAMSKTGLEIAVIGMAGRFPGAQNIREFWDNLKNGIESISFFSDRELEEAGLVPGEINDPAYVKAKGVLEGAEYFDASFFGYTPVEAKIMDPQVRMFHQCSWEALEDAGYDPETYKGKIGVYAGASTNLNWQALSVLSGAAGALDTFSAAQLIDKDYLTTRISFKFNLRGPSFVVQTACSTSLVAIHLASQGLLSGECSMALAGGVTATIPRKGGYIYQEGMVMSPDGHCRAFDARANGFAGGNGAGVVVLKLLEEAAADGDFIHAVIKGSAVNNDGNQKSGFTAPSIKAQREVIKGALLMAEVEPESIGYIETHGTATPLGDPIEIESLKRAFNTGKRGFCKIGSVKTNVGHLDAAAGAAGFIKTVLALKHRQIPPSLYFKTPNPKIDFENSPFVVNTRLEEWGNEKYPLRAGVSSFGIGGTNAHLILEAWSMEHGARREEYGDHRLILLSAKTKSALDQITENLCSHLKNNPVNPANPVQTLADVAYTLQVGRKPLNHRRMVVCASVDEAAAGLSDLTKIPYNLVIEDKRRVVFMFAGLGSQYTDMGLELYQKEPAFREEMDRCFDILTPLLEVSVKNILYPGEEPGVGDRHACSPGEINRVDISQLVVFIIEYALARLLMKWGIKPRSMIGYSFGEYTAACLSGVFSLEDALKIIVCRGKLLQEIPGGTMLSVPLPASEVTPLLTGELSIAIDNGSSCIVAGPGTAVAAFEQQVKQKKLMCMPVPHSVAMHSKMMEPILAKFEQELGKVPLNPPQIPYISNLTGKWINAGDVVKPTYWSGHLKETVRFSEGVMELVKTPDSIFIEIGPGRDLSTMVKRFMDEKTGQKVLNLIRPPQKSGSDVHYLLNKIGYLWLYGVNVDWRAFYSREKRCRVPLPTYPFEGTRYWFDGDPLRAAGEMLLSGSLPGKKAEIEDWFYIPQWNRSTLSPDSGIPGEPTCWLLFTNESLLGTRLVQRLKKDNHHMIIARAGSTFGSVEGNEYTINPFESGDYDRLFKELVKSGHVPVNIVHLWGLTGEANHKITLEELDRTQDLGLYSLLNIARAVGSNSIANNIKMGVITDNMQPVTGDETLRPEKATILGPVKVIPLEYPNIKCLSIDIFDPGPDQQRMNFIVESLLREFAADLPGNRVVAYRGAYRWIEGYEPVRLGSSSQKTALKEKGVYLVTGGFGGMGFTLVGHLAKTLKARLILVDLLTPPTGEKLDEWLYSDHRKKDIHLKRQRIKELEKCGAEFQIHDADVSDYPQMKGVFSKAAERFGKIDGVIHTAGLIDYAGVIQGRTRQMTEELLAAKVRGTLVLDTLLEDRDIDFWVLFSSVGNIFYKLKFGQVGYNAGHEFLASFAYQKQKEGTFTVTIDWNDWLERGMAVRAAEKTGPSPGESDIDNLLAITPAEGTAVFNRILGNDLLSRVIVSPVDVGAAVDFMKRPPADIFDTGPFDSPGVEDLPDLMLERPQLSTPYKAPANDIQRTIARIWETFFGIKQVGTRDDFFELGGDSLKAMNVSALIQKKLKVEIPVVEFFNRQTVEGLADYVTSSEEKKDDFPLKPVEKKEYYPVSSAQRRLYVLQQMGEQSTGYNEQLAVTLEGNLVKERLEDALKHLMRRHESFRTSFGLIGGMPVQRVHNQVDFAVGYFDGKDRVVEEIVNGFIRPFDLAQPPLLRVGVIKKEGSQYVMIVDMHHIIRDGLSHNIFINDFMALYKGQDLPGLRLQYKDFSQWQNYLFESGKILEQEKYWLREFEVEPPVLNLPADYSRPAILSFEGDQIIDVIDNEETIALQRVASEQDATLFMALLAVFNIFLSKVGGQEDIVCGSAIAGRRCAELQDIIGMFVNTLALRNHPCPGKTFIEFLRDTRGKTLLAYENQDYQFETLVDKVVKNRDTGRNQLFDVMFSFHNFLDAHGETASEEMAGLKIKPCIHKKNTSIFDLYLSSYENRGKLYITFEYSTNLFKKETVVRFISYFRKIFASVVVDPGIKIADIEIISGEEKKQILVDFNAAEVPYPEDKTIVDLFGKQAEKTPNNTALIFEDQQVTYEALVEMAERVGQLLIGRGIGTNVMVGVMTGRSIEMMAAIFGILKAGGAYLPIDPAYPAERIHYMLADSGARILLSKVSKVSEVSEDFEVIDLVRIIGPIGPIFKKLPAHPTQPCYVIYTSGSTGKPKGVIIEHRSLVNRLNWMQKQYVIDAGDTLLQKTPFTFDVSVWEIFWWAFVGARLCLLVPGGEKDPAVITDTIEKNNVTVIHFVPSMLTAFLEYLKDSGAGERLAGLKQVIASGEALTPHQVNSFNELLGGDSSSTPKLDNLYGPTEATIDVSYFPCPTGAPLDRIPIGKPIDNTHLYVVDDNMHLQPVGVAGELCISGDGLARGYLNRPELTAGKFPTHPLNHSPYSTIYRTGDLARWLPDGNIDFLGRLDHQVKIRGFRIELGEIENRLLKHKEIKEAVVLLKEGTEGKKHLSAYIVSDREFNVSRLREYLSGELPDYMVPSYFAQVKKIPITPNGKVDRGTLEKYGTGLGTGIKFEAPQNDIEKKIVEIWKEVLQADKVGTHDNFFDLGGNSIDIIKVNSRLKEVFEKDIPVVSFFRYTTIKSFVRYLGQEGDNDFQSSDRTEVLKRGEETKMKKLNARRRGVK